MTDNVKADLKKKEKPPTQTAGVVGIDAHKAMGSEPVQSINWFKLIALPPFEMFVYEQSGLGVGDAAHNWVSGRIAALGEVSFYEKYAEWHTQKGLWPKEDPMGQEL